MHLLKKFLTEEDVRDLLHVWEDERAFGWNLHRAEKNYRFAPCLGAPIHLSERALAALPEREELKYEDSFFIHYGNGGMTRPHKDTRTGLRLNALLITPKFGSLVISDRVVFMEVGDAVVFEPNIEEHQVTTVKGERLIWSVGRAKTPGVVRRRTKERG